MKPWAVVHVDLDGSGAVLRHFGCEASGSGDEIFETAVPRFLDLFDSLDIPATFFVIGSDIDVPWKRALIEEVARRGHEIANHSLTHPTSFSSLSPEQKLREIQEAGERIRSLTGTAPAGFRAPDFETDSAVFEILAKLGYGYDSSILSTYWSPLIRRLKRAMGPGPIPSERYSGRAAFGLAPNRPYFPSVHRIWQRGRMPLPEIPVTTIPFMRAPMHATYALTAREAGLGMLLPRLGIDLCRRLGLPVTFLFHAGDLAGPFQEPGLANLRAWRSDPAERESICREILVMLRQGHRIVRTRDVVA